MSPNNCDKCGHDKNMCECPKGSKQIGGDHYEAKYQHWDFVADTDIGYLEGNASKYILRWKTKGKPLEDLGKARSYIYKIMELHSKNGYRNRSKFTRDKYDQNHARAYFNKFCLINNIPQAERNIINLINGWLSKNGLNEIILMIDDLIVECKAALVAPQVAPQGNGPQMQSKDAPEASCGKVGSTKGQQANTSTSVEQPFGYESKREI